ncbi:hypothetical protein [Sphingomonas sp. SORGH_AS_0950]|uniref:hypothetical protein n=1 Tax=Sphingomonas sp. SORGH_AS_0950 TaxID=3041792 RepID=UPI0027D89819|nr:hypothetical protein [Sphingomonas sp. SORGH_AS_0950]
MPRISHRLDFYRDAGHARLWIDRAGLDALFATRHASMTRHHAVPLIERCILRADPPLTVLVADIARPPPYGTRLRFRRTGDGG